jgi:hypothetical protein
MDKIQRIGRSIVQAVGIRHVTKHWKLKAIKENVTLIRHPFN